MNIHQDMNTAAVKFLKALSPDIEKALMLNKRFAYIETPISEYEDLQDAYSRLILDEVEFNLTESIMILSNPHFHGYVRPFTYADESQTDATRRHAAVAYSEAVRQTAANIYSGMWQDWLHGKGSCAEIINRLDGQTDEQTDENSIKR